MTTEASASQSSQSEVAEDALSQESLSPEILTHPPSSQPTKRSSKGLLVVLILQLAIAIVGVFGWLTLKTQLTLTEQELVTMHKRIDTLNPRSELERLNNTLGSRITHIKTRIENLQGQQDSLRTAVVKAYDLASRTQRGWIIAEAQYLTRIAQQRLHLMRDLGGAITALEAVDRQLEELADPRFSPILAALKADIATLKAFPQPDLEAISFKLDQIIIQSRDVLIEKPSVSPIKQSSDTKPTVNSPEVPERSQNGVFMQLIHEVNKHLVIRRHDQSMPPLPDAQTQLYRYQLLRLKLEAVRLAVLQENDVEYHRLLRSVLALIGTHYSLPNAKPLIDELKGLQHLHIRPEMPTIHRSIRVLSQWNGSEELN